jgi:N-acetylglutamate synthase-like GNAT family acetyltransferase
LFVRQASVKDLQMLNQILYHSEAYWNHYERYMAGFISLFQMNETDLNISIGRIIEKGGTIIGFFRIEPKGNSGELDYFYIRRDCIGKGFGHRLWLHMLQVCRDNGISELTWVTDPGALPFYLKMGAREMGWTRSKINGKRLIPKMKYSLS